MEQCPSYAGSRGIASQWKFLSILNPACLNVVFTNLTIAYIQSHMTSAHIIVQYLLNTGHNTIQTLSPESHNWSLFFRFSEGSVSNCMFWTSIEFSELSTH
jgi:hypothetical protein